MTAPDTRAVWQTKPCPSWCTTVHHSADHPASRLCHDHEHSTILSREATLSSRNGTWTPEAMGVSMEAPTTGGDPYLLLYLASGEGIEATLDEAESIATQILSRVMEARNAQPIMHATTSGGAS